MIRIKRRDVCISSILPPDRTSLAVRCVTCIGVYRTYARLGCYGVTATPTASRTVGESV